MSSTPKGDSGFSTPSPHASHHAHHHAHRLMQFVRPDGRKVHIAHTPEHHVQLQKQLTEDNPDEDFDVIIHGTPEHVSLPHGTFDEQDLTRLCSSRLSANSMPTTKLAETHCARRMGRFMTNLNMSRMS